jgi:hypothetical protein
MKRSGPCQISRRKTIQSISHFIGGFVRKRQRDDLPGRNSVGDHPCNSMRDHASLSTAWSSDDQQWTFGVLDGGTLRIVKSGE